MSNPSINRWGLNLFWFRMWYADKNQPLIINQDMLFNRLIFIYVRYGLFHLRAFFLNNYWYFGCSNIIINFLNNNFTKYFRIIEYKNKVLNKFSQHRVRNEIKNIYFTKIWIMKYQNWLILNLYNYQPLKKKTQNKINSNKEIDYYLEKNKKNITMLRFKFLLLFTLNNLLTKNIYYKF